MHSCNITCPHCNRVIGGYRLEINEIFQCRHCHKDLRFLGIKNKIMGICEEVTSGPRSKAWFTSELKKAANILDMVQAQAGDQVNWDKTDRAYVRLQSNNYKNNILLLSEYIEEIEERNEG